MDDLSESIARLLGATSWAEQADIVDAHPALTDAATTGALQRLLAAGQLDDLHAAALDELRQDLMTCATRGDTTAIRVRTTLRWPWVWDRFSVQVSAAYAAHERFAAGGDPAALEEAENRWRAIENDADLADTPEGFQLLVLDGVAAAQLARSTVLDDPQALDDGIAGAAEAARRTPADGHFRGRRLTNLSAGLLSRAQQRRDHDAAGLAAADLAAGAEAARGAVEATDPGDPLWPGRVNNLVGALTAQSENDPEARERVLGVLDTAVAAASSNPTVLGRLLHARGTVHAQAYRRDKDLGELDRAIAAFGEAVARGGAQHPDAGMFLRDWALHLGTRFDERGHVADLDTAVEAAGAAVERTPARHPQLGDRWTTLGLVRRARFGTTRDRADLTAAARAFRAAWQLAGRATSAAALERYGNTLEQLRSVLQNEVRDAGDGGRPGLLRELADVTLDLHRITRDPSLLDQAIDGYERAVREGRIEERPESLIRLTLAVRTRARSSGDRADFDRAVDTAADAVTLDPLHPGVHNDLGLVLADRYQAFGDVDDLTSAIAELRMAADTVTPDDPDATGVVSNLVSLLREHAEHTSDRSTTASSLDEAIERGLAVPTGSDAISLTVTAVTAESLLRRSTATGDEADLDRALDLCWSATDRGRARSGAHGGVYNALGGALRARYWRDGDPADLTQSAAAYRIACELAPQAGYLGNLGSTLRVIHGVTGDPGALAEAVATLTDAVARAEHDRSERGLSLMNLGLGLLSRFHADADPADLAEGIARLRAAAEDPDAAPDVRRWSRVNLGGALLDRIGEDDTEDAAHALDEAITVLRGESANGPFIPRAALLLGSALRLRSERNRDPAAAREGRRQLREAAERGLDTDIEAAVAAASALTEWMLVRRSWGSACDAARLAIEAKERALAAQFGEGGREHWLRLSADVTASAAYTLARAGRLDEAVDTIEHGRARVLAEALDLDRADLDRLAELGHPELHRRFRAAARRASASARAASADASLRALSTSAETVHSARQQLDEVVAEIRTIPGYETLLRHLSTAEIAEAARHAPLVYLLTTVAGGLALIVTPRAGTEGLHIVPVWLDGIDRDRLRAMLAGRKDRAAGYLAAQLRYRRRAHDAAARKAWFGALEEASAWIGDAVMRPVLAALADVGNVAETGVTLVPAGLLGLLPLHAAWTRADDGGREYAIDALTIRYAPNARAILAARTRYDGLGDDRLLLVADPQPVTADPLPSVPEEAAGIVRHWSAARRTQLWGRDATTDAVAAGLESHTVFHFAGHAFADWATPAQGGLMLSGDAVLTVESLARRRVALRLAVLSACETGVAGARVPDEVVGLPTALVQAGACGVIASLWPVPDASTSELMNRVYGLWRAKGVEPGEALRRAQTAMRDRGLPPHHWAAFAYTGI